MKKVIDLLQQLSIEYKNLSLYEIAFTHASYANEKRHKKLENNQRLEYLGDAVLDLVFAQYLYNKKQEFAEGKMTKLRAKYVCEGALFEYASDLGFGDYIKLGHGEMMHGGNKKSAILADCFEAFIGALYLDKGLDEVSEFIYSKVIKNIEHGIYLESKDYKTILQELVQSDKRTIEYETIKVEGPAHDRVFTTIVKMDNITFGTGVGKSKKESEQNAAHDALDKVAKQN